MRLWLLSLAATSVLASPVGAQDAADSIVAAALARYPTPGISIAVTRHGQVIKAKGYGYANLEHRVPATDSTIYQTGSIGKAFTAAAVMVLAQQGKLALEDPVSKFFPKFPARWRHVRLRHLLSHTSGIRDRIYQRVDLRRDYPESTLVRMIGEEPFEAPVGSRWEYSNQGYHLLGYLITKSQARFYGDIIGTEIFAPLGMHSSRVIDEPAIIPHRAAGYELARGGFGPVRNQAYVSPTLNRTGDGSIYTNVLDMAKWDLALYTDRPLTAASRARSWTPTVLTTGTTYPYGFAWSVDSANGHWVVEHSGAWQGFTTHIARYPNDSLGVVVLTNCACGDPSRIAHDLAEAYLPGLRPARPAATAADPRTAEALRRWLDRLAGNGPTVPADSLPEPWTTAERADWASWVAAHGAIGAVTIDRVEIDHGRSVHSFRFSVGPIGLVGGATHSAGRLVRLEIAVE